MLNPTAEDQEAWCVVLGWLRWAAFPILGETQFAMEAKIYEILGRDGPGEGGLVGVWASDSRLLNRKREGKIRGKWGREGKGGEARFERGFGFLGEAEGWEGRST